MNPDADYVNNTKRQRPRPTNPLYPKLPEKMPAVPLGARFNWGHQKTPSGRSLYPTSSISVFHRSLTQLPQTGNLWVDASNTVEDGGLSNQPYHIEAYSRKMGALSYDRRVPPGTYVEPKLFNQSTHPKWKTKKLDRFQQAKLTRERRCYSVPRRGSFPEGPKPCAVFCGFVEWQMERSCMNRGEMDRLMSAACSSKYPCSRPATYEEFISYAIAGLPSKNETKFDITFTGPGSEKIGPGGLDHKNTLFARKKIIFPGGLLDGSSGEIEINDSSCWGRKACIAVVYVNRLKLQPSLKHFGALRNTVKHGTNPEDVEQDQTQWNAFPHLYTMTNTHFPI